MNMSGFESQDKEGVTVMAVRWQTNVSLSCLNGRHGVMMVKSDGSFMFPRCVSDVTKSLYHVVL